MDIYANASMPRVMVTSGAQDTTLGGKGKPAVAVVVEACGQEGTASAESDPGELAGGPFLSPAH